MKFYQIVVMLAMSYLTCLLVTDGQHKQTTQNQEVCSSQELVMCYVVNRCNDDFVA